MGQLFKYISNALIEEHNETGECPVCEQHAVLFEVEAAPSAKEWSVNEYRVDELCADCIRRLPLRKFNPRDSERYAQQIISQKYPKGKLSGQQRQDKMVGLCDEFRRTPNLAMFLQREDWPYCCGDFMELQGSPKSYEESIRIGKDVPYWSRGIRSFAEDFGGETLEPEALAEISLFQCRDCKKTVFVWQCS